MFNKKKILSGIAGAGFFLSVASGTALAQKPVEMPASKQENVQFRRIEQPLGLKVAVTLGGIGLIGLELWWFLLSKSKAVQANRNQDIQEITIIVDGGYEPNQVVVEAGQPVRLNFERRDASSCLEKVLVPDFHIAQDLTLNQVTTVEFTPEKPGEYPFTCGMNMYRGKILAQSS
ncbi:cupredoxin domain-containing protein [Calothrix sp. CCY 0018]|uniref:cupredoxin domain-containing protein n=1 Tax=Calothrix sp. CCY 0018 TaxID=3103864 RepID=UPI0039C64A7C